MHETWVQSVGWEDPLERAWQPTPVFAWRISMDRGAWWATVHRVAKSWARLGSYLFPDIVHLHNWATLSRYCSLHILLQWTWERNRYFCFSRADPQKQQQDHRIYIPLVFIEATGLPSKVAVIIYAPTNNIQKYWLPHILQHLMPKIDTCIKWILSARHSFECFMCVKSFDVYNPVR